MKWKDTIASKCRWSEYAAPMFADSYDVDIILGTAPVVAVMVGKDETLARVMQDMSKLAMPLSREAAIALLEKRKADAWDDEKVTKYAAALTTLRAAGDVDG